MFFSFVKHHQVVAHYFRAEPLILVLVLPISCSDTAFYVYEAALVQVFLSQLCKAAPEDYSMPFGLRNKGAVFIFISLCGSQRKLCYGYISFQVLQIWFPAKISYQYNLIYASHSSSNFQIIKIIT
jgi:hypothetical protein